MIRQNAFLTKGPMLKGGLHCHTARVDGDLTPEEVMRLHKAHGYDFLAITDHSLYNFKNYLPELGLTILPGMEYDSHVNLPDQCGFRCFDTICIGPSKEDGNGFEQDVPVEKNFSVTCEQFQPALDAIHAKKNLTIYSHPVWSNTSAKYILGMRGNFAMEIWNSGSAIENDMDTDAAYWDEVLGQGLRLFGVAVDDGHRLHQHCHGWVMVNAENTVNAILHALETGCFYSSCGPEIYDFYYEDGKAVVECSGAAKIRLHSDAHPTRILRDPSGKMTRGEFDLHPVSPWDNYAYIRATIIDAEGKYAWTNPIFLK